MKADLFHLCDDKEWPKVRKYLSSDASEEEKKSNIMYRGDHGRTCLHRACFFDAPDDIIKTMIDIGGKELVMKVNINNQTALHWACWNGTSYNIIKMLIEVGGKDLVMAKDEGGKTTLHDLCLCIKRHAKAAEIIKLILQVGDTNLLLATKNRVGQTPLEMAIEEGASKEIQKLLTVQSNSKRKPGDVEHQEEGEEGSGAVSQSKSSKRSRSGNAADTGYPNSRSEMYHKFMNRDRGLD
jgi:ankyrin repeat protein